MYSDYIRTNKLVLPCKQRSPFDNILLCISIPWKQISPLDNKFLCIPIPWKQIGSFVEFSYVWLHPNKRAHFPSPCREVSLFDKGPLECIEENEERYGQQTYLCGRWRCFILLQDPKGCETFIDVYECKQIWGTCINVTHVRTFFSFLLQLEFKCAHSHLHTHVPN